MVYELSTLAGRSKSSRLQDFLGSAPAAVKGALLTTRPGPPNRIPFASDNQLILFGGKGLNGQSVPIRTAMIAMPQRIPKRFFSRSACQLSFTDKAWRKTSRCSTPENLTVSARARRWVDVGMERDWSGWTRQFGGRSLFWRGSRCDGRGKATVRPDVGNKHLIWHVLKRRNY